MWRWRDGASVLVLRARVLHQNAPMNENERKRTDERTDERVRPALVVGRRHQSNHDAASGGGDGACDGACDVEDGDDVVVGDVVVVVVVVVVARAVDGDGGGDARADGETGTREGGAGETVGKETTTRRRPRAMEVTPSASRRIKELLRARNKEYLKIGVKTRGCNGMTYTMNYAEEGERKKFDELVETDDGVKIIVEPNALMSIIGTKMDYVSDRLRSEFVFENPNAKAECGCGESFTVCGGNARRRDYYLIY